MDIQNAFGNNLLFNGGREVFFSKSYQNFLILMFKTAFQTGYTVDPQKTWV